MLNVVEMYYLTEGEVKYCTPMPITRHAEMVVTVDNPVYCISSANPTTHQSVIVTIEALDFI
ncbi:hypothetical protein MUBE_06370 [Mycobacterium uberis]|uniref:Uncharacterized protein n=1 Tax=Mycobacterium uberis TaxID=2162698 RepID=A0A3E1HHX8_9MYCO|nr:hypothetical protein [Mycobacterium uberis]RFD26058.1 hypothetical protein MUBE_06370 [Mycobacterium uberis]